MIGYYKLRITRMKRIFDDKIKDACVPKFSENNICQIREIRS